MQEEEVHECTRQVEAELRGQSFVLFEDHLTQGHAVNEPFCDVKNVGLVYALLFLFQLLLVLAEIAVVDIHLGLSLTMLCLKEFLEVLSFVVEIPLKLLNIMRQFLLLVFLQLLVIYPRALAGQFLYIFDDVIERLVAVLVLLAYLLQLINHFLSLFLVGVL